MSRNDEVLAVLEATESVVCRGPMRDRLITDLQPIAERLPVYEQEAKNAVVRNKAEADSAAALCEQIAADMKVVESHDILAGVIDGFHKLHKRLVGLRSAFVDPMKAARSTLRGKVIAWQEDEAAKAEAERRRLQAIADEEARKERARLEAQAAKLKTPEKQAERLEQAAAVEAVVVQVEAPKALNVRRVWVANVIDAKAFCAAIATRPDLLGYVEVSETKLARAKAANQLFEAAGVEFKQEVR